MSKDKSDFNNELYENTYAQGRTPSPREVNRAVFSSSILGKAIKTIKKAFKKH